MNCSQTSGGSGGKAGEGEVVHLRKGSKSCVKHLC